MIIKLTMCFEVTNPEYDMVGKIDDEVAPLVQDFLFETLMDQYIDYDRVSLSIELGTEEDLT